MPCLKKKKEKRSGRCAKDQTWTPRVSTYVVSTLVAVQHQRTLNSAKSRLFIWLVGESDQHVVECAFAQSTNACIYFIICNGGFDWALIWIQLIVSVSVKPLLQVAFVMARQLGGLLLDDDSQSGEMRICVLGDEGPTVRLI